MLIMRYSNACALINGIFRNVMVAFVQLRLSVLLPIQRCSEDWSSKWCVLDPIAAFSINNSFICFSFQRHLRQLSACARTFGAVLELADIDLSIFQDAVTVAIGDPALHPFLPEAVAYLFDMTSLQQREMEGFGHWYHETVEHAVFGTEDDPIIIEE
jgi:hypothetical protein